MHMKRWRRSGGVTVSSHLSSMILYSSSFVCSCYVLLCVCVLFLYFTLNAVCARSLFFLYLFLFCIVQRSCAMLSEISSLLFNNWALTLSGSCLKHTLMNSFCMVWSFRSIQSIRFRLKLSIKPNIYINSHFSHAHT